MIDKNPKKVSIASAGAQFFQFHDDGMIWRWTGKPCKDNPCPGWQKLDSNGKIREIVLQCPAVNIYQRLKNGRIYRYTGPGCSGDSCPSWGLLDNNGKTRDIAVGGFN